MSDPPNQEPDAAAEDNETVHVPHDDVAQPVDRQPSPPSAIQEDAQQETKAEPEVHRQEDEADSSESLSPAPSPLTTTHRPTSSKTSIDEHQPLTPLDSPGKADRPQKEPSPEAAVQDVVKETAQVDQEEKSEEREASKTPATVVESPKTVAPLPENKFDVVLELNAELFNVYNQFHVQNQVQALRNELQQYSDRIHANLQWLKQFDSPAGSPFPPTRVPLQITTPPPPISFTTTERIDALYTHLNTLLDKDAARDLRRQQMRQSITAVGPNAATPRPSSISSTPEHFNLNGKRERPDDLTSDQAGGAAHSPGGAHSPRKRVDTGESKLGNVAGSSRTTPSPAHLHASPSRMETSPAPENGMNPLSGHIPPGAPGGPARPSSSQSNTSAVSASMPPPSAFPLGGTPQQQADRLRAVQQQQHRMRGMSVGSSGIGSPMTMNASPQTQPPRTPLMSHSPTSQPGPQQPQNNLNHNLFGITPQPVPQAILPQLLAMIQNPMAHQSVQVLMNKLPQFRMLAPEQQASLLWSFQNNQMKAQQYQDHQRQLLAREQRQQQQQQQQQHQQQQQQQQQQANMGMMQGVPGGMGMGGMNMGPPGSGGMMPPPPPSGPNAQALHQQRQLNLMQQQQAHGRPGMMPGPGGGYPNVNGGINNMGMGPPGGGHVRMPSNPTMGPPPVPISVQHQGGMSPYAGAPSPSPTAYGQYGAGSPQQFSGPPQQHMSPQSAGSAGSMAGSPPPPSSSAGWSPMSTTPSASVGTPGALTPAAILQQRAAKVAASGGHGYGMSEMDYAASPAASIDPHATLSWQDLGAT